MNNNYKTNTYGNRIKLIACVVAAVLAFALVAGLVFGLTKNKNAGLASAGGNGGAQLSVVDAKGISLMIAPLDMEAADSEYTPDPEAESTYILTATVTPGNVKNKAINWSIKFNNPSAEWAKDKDLTDYVKLTPIGENKAALDCMSAFAEQIKVTATSDKDETKSAVCMVDYKQKISNLSVTLDKVIFYPLSNGLSYTDGRRIMQARVFPDCEETNTAHYEVSYELSEVYTIKNTDVPRYYFTFSVNNGFFSKLNEEGYNTDEMPEVSFGYEFETEGTVNNFFDKGWFYSLLDGDVTAERVNALINLLVEYDEDIFTFFAYEYDGGAEICSYDVWLDVSVIMDQYQVENVQTGDSNIVF